MFFFVRFFCFFLLFFCFFLYFCCIQVWSLRILFVWTLPLESVERGGSRFRGPEGRFKMNASEGLSKCKDGGALPPADGVREPRNPTELRLPRIRIRHRTHQCEGTQAECPVDCAGLARVFSWPQMKRNISQSRTRRYCKHLLDALAVTSSVTK